MYCDNCGSRNDFDAVFCKKCGFNFNKNNKKLNNKKKLKEILSKLNNKKDQIIAVVIGTFIIILSLTTIYKNSDLVKYRNYLEKQNFNCDNNTCIKKDNLYDIEIVLNEKRLVYKMSKVNEKITFNYAGNDLGSFQIEDSLSKFTCSYVDGKVNTNSCLTELEKAGTTTYLNKMNNIVDEVKEIISKSDINF